MVINTTALGKAIGEKYSSAEEFSAQIGWTTAKTLCLLAGEYLPDVEECAAIADALDLTQSAFYEIFLPKISRKRETEKEKHEKENEENPKNIFSESRALLLDPDGRVSFDGCLAMARELAAETAVQIASSRQGGMGIIELSTPLLVLDENCSFGAWETLCILLSSASSVLIRPDGAVCRLRFGFRLKEEA